MNTRSPRREPRHGVADALSGAGDDDAEATLRAGVRAAGAGEEGRGRRGWCCAGRGAREERRTTCVAGRRRDETTNTNATRSAGARRSASPRTRTWSIARRRTRGRRRRPREARSGAILPVYPALVVGRTTRENISRPMIGRVPIESEPRRSASRIDRGRSGRSDRSSFQSARLNSFQRQRRSSSLACERCGNPASVPQFGARRWHGPPPGPPPPQRAGGRLVLPRDVPSARASRFWFSDGPPRGRGRGKRWGRHARCRTIRVLKLPVLIVLSVAAWDMFATTWPAFHRGVRPGVFVLLASSPSQVRRGPRAPARFSDPHPEYVPPSSRFPAHPPSPPPLQVAQHLELPHASLQRHVIRILFMVPIYAVDCWLALRSKTPPLLRHRPRVQGGHIHNF